MQNSEDCVSFMLERRLVNLTHAMIYYCKTDRAEKCYNVMHSGSSWHSFICPQTCCSLYVWLNESSTMYCWFIITGVSRLLKPITQYSFVQINSLKWTNLLLYMVYHSSGIIHCQKFSLFTQIDKNKKHEIFLLTNNLVNKVLWTVACSQVFFLRFISRL